MTPFEQELKKALARQEPPADFTERLFTRLAEEKAAADEKGKLRWWRRIPRRPSQSLWALAPVCALILLTSGTVLYTRHEEAIEGERAKQQLMLALRITGSKLHATQRQLHEVESEKQL